MVDPVFGPFFLGKVLSSSGIWIHNIVAAIVAFELTGSALVVGAVTAVQFTPQLLFAPLSGKMADRGNAALQIVAGRIVTGLGSGFLADAISVSMALVGHRRSRRRCIVVASRHRPLLRAAVRRWPSPVLGLRR